MSADVYTASANCSTPPEGSKSSNEASDVNDSSHNNDVIPPTSSSPHDVRTSSTPSAVRKDMDFDDLLDLIGQFGRFQLVVFVLLSAGILAEVMLVMAFVFVAAVPVHWCATPELDALNLTDEVRVNVTIPVSEDGSTDGQATYSQCTMYNRSYVNWTTDDVYRYLAGGNIDNATTVKCRSGWNYDLSVYSSTIVTQWDLVCDDSWMASFAYTVIGLGQLVGAAFFGQLTDRFGRKRPYYVAVALMVASSVGVSFSPNYAVYCVLQFFVGVNTVACFATAVTLAVELVGVSWRGHLGTAVNYFWTFGYMLLAAVAYGLRDWSLLQLVVAASSSLLLLSALIVPESPRWLYSRHRAKSADDVMRRMTRFNGIEMPRDVTIHVEDIEDGNRVSCMAMFRTRRLRVISALLFLNWFSNALIYYGISLFMPTFSGNDYLNFFISGAVEIPGYLIAQLSIRYLGRRLPLCVTMLFGGVALLVTMAVPANLEWLSLTLTLLGKLCATASWAIVICFTAELYPTVVRGLGMFTCTLCGNIGNAVAPLVGLLDQFHPFVPLLLFGAFSIVAGVTSLWLPETRDTHLLDTIDVTEQIAKFHLPFTADSKTLDNAVSNRASDVQLSSFKQLPAEKITQTIA